MTAAPGWLTDSSWVSSSSMPWAEVALTKAAKAGASRVLDAKSGAFPEPAWGAAHSCSRRPQASNEPA